MNLEQKYEALRNATDHTSYWKAYVAIEQAANSAWFSYEESKSITDELSLINREVAPRIEALVSRKPFSLDDVTSKVCADIMDSIGA